MTRFFRGAVSAVLFTVGLGSTAFATTALELVVNGVDTIYVPDNGPVVCTGPDCGTAVLPTTDTNILTGDISLSGTIDGWTISQSSGGSNSPTCPSFGVGGPGCLNTDNFNAVSTGLGSLTVYFESSGFTAQPGFVVGFGSTGVQTGLLAAQTAYIGPGAVNLAAGNLTPAPVGAACGATINSAPPGVVSALTGCGAGSGTLEIQTAFTTGATGGGFNVNGNISSTIPEPASVVLFGTLLALCATAFRGRRKLS